MSDSGAPLDLEPPDDRGAQTAAWYRYQAELAARPCLAMLAGEPIQRVICEWHEDYVVSRPNALTELVSVKHQEPGQAPWSASALCDRGGLAHLFDRWRAAGGRVSCTLQTNAGMGSGREQPSDLKRSCHVGDSAGIRAWAARLAPHLAGGGDVASHAVIEDFLRMLRIEDVLPSRQHVRGVNLAEVMPSVMRRLRRPAELAPQIYDAVVGVVERASRLDGRADVLESLADPGRLDASSEAAYRLAAKTIDLDTLERAVSNLPPTAALLHVPPRPRRRTKLQQKLEAGGMGLTGIANARNLRANWEDHVSRWRVGLSNVRDDFDDIRARVLMIAHEVENEFTTASPYAPRMYARLVERFGTGDLRVPGAGAANEALLLGCAFALTDECHIAWSSQDANR